MGLGDLLNTLASTEHHFREEQARQGAATTNRSCFTFTVHLHLRQGKPKGDWVRLETHTHACSSCVCVSSELPVWQHSESATPGARANLGTDAFPSEPASGPVARFVALAMREVRQRIAETWERIIYISSLRCGMPFLGIPL